MCCKYKGRRRVTRDTGGGNSLKVPRLFYAASLFLNHCLLDMSAGSRHNESQNRERMTQNTS
ncbi:hypothetical protein AtNW77_Chr2g0248981 [Arabidopsis thaliana]|uniref:Uncharacterized protein n=4 Tax=Arabidopsis TaxID=3701 RepID=A0A654EYM0_ARATH|nr:uncharacterized protein AT2G29263 [Arabidopsis thaliana]KAG7637850.1 hypothetical protein ISN45_At02g023400 [Arabidopsis thaliana x Arabidopsis arenosa]KAG7642466.1 hypothetical protein ISN44_As02g023760 [Arabidopsis suecica]AEC08227.1 hypothetical protein AT2G29263 [Arabidopsis thaliana]CAA0373148.1 unnamed protein product [Arabidopsis thaliana]VYS53870.1 unnamed protein product [Arabidopsis thaliana]|eukprot:NP_001118407.1 hypothetical protein AT2G29263 [Arabidopsis thaliana]